MPLFRGFHDAARPEFPAAPPRLAVYEALRRLLNALVTDLIDEVRARVSALGATTLDDIRRAPQRLAALSAQMEAERAAVKEFLYANLYNSPGTGRGACARRRGGHRAFRRPHGRPGLMPQDHQAQIPTEGLARTVADYIAGMTDSYIVQLWSEARAAAVSRLTDYFAGRNSILARLSTVLKP